MNTFRKRAATSPLILIVAAVLVVVLVMAILPAMNTNTIAGATTFLQERGYTVSFGGGGGGSPLSVLINGVSKVIATSSDAQDIIDAMAWNGVDGVYVDSVNGVAGTGAGVGTPQNPVSNLTDALTIAGARKLSKFYLIDVPTEAGYVLPSDLASGFTFIGDGTDNFGVFDPNGKDTHFSVLKGMWINGNMVSTDTLEIHNSRVNDLEGGGAAFIYDSQILQLGLKYVRIFDSSFVTCYLDATGATSPSLLINVSGSLEIAKLTNAATISIYGNGMDLLIDNDCTAGTINIYGSVDVTDNSTGTTVNDYSINTKLNTIITQTAP